MEPEICHPLPLKPPLMPDFEISNHQVQNDRLTLLFQHIGSREVTFTNFKEYSNISKPRRILQVHFYRA